CGCSTQIRPATALIFQERQQLWARVMHTGPDCFDDLGYLAILIPSRRAVGCQSLGLAVEMARVLGGRHPRVEGDRVEGDPTEPSWPSVIMMVCGSILRPGMLPSRNQRQAVSYRTPIGCA